MVNDLSFTHLFVSKGANNKHQIDHFCKSDQYKEQEEESKSKKDQKPPTGSLAGQRENQTAARFLVLDNLDGRH